MSNPGGFLSTLQAGVTGALKQFLAELPSTLKNGLYSWLPGSVDAGLDVFRNLDLSHLDAKTGLSFLLQYAGLTWDHVYQVVQQQIGAGSRAAIEAARKGFGGGHPPGPTH